MYLIVGEDVQNSRMALNDYIVSEYVDGVLIHKCTLCSKTNGQKHHTRNHIESVHFPNLFSYTCPFCSKEYNSKNSLHVHISTKHKEKY